MAEEKNLITLSAEELTVKFLTTVGTPFLNILFQKQTKKCHEYRAVRILHVCMHFDLTFVHVHVHLHLNRLTIGSPFYAAKGLLN